MRVCQYCTSRHSYVVYGYWASLICPFDHPVIPRIGQWHGLGTHASLGDGCLLVSQVKTLFVSTICDSISIPLYQFSRPLLFLYLTFTLVYLAFLPKCNIEKMKIEDPTLDRHIR